MRAFFTAICSYFLILLGLIGFAIQWAKKNPVSTEPITQGSRQHSLQRPELFSYIASQIPGEISRVQKPVLSPCKVQFRNQSLHD